MNVCGRCRYTVLWFRSFSRSILPLTNTYDRPYPGDRTPRVNSTHLFFWHNNNKYRIATLSAQQKRHCTLDKTIRLHRGPFYLQGSAPNVGCTLYEYLFFFFSIGNTLTTRYNLRQYFEWWVAIVYLNNFTMIIRLLGGGRNPACLTLTKYIILLVRAGRGIVPRRSGPKIKMNWMQYMPSLRATNAALPARHRRHGATPFIPLTVALRFCTSILASKMFALRNCYFVCFRPIQVGHCEWEGVIQVHSKCGYYYALVLSAKLTSCLSTFYCPLTTICYENKHPTTVMRRLEFLKRMNRDSGDATQSHDITFFCRHAFAN